MKEILSLVLAVAMLSGIAFATTGLGSSALPGDEIAFAPSDFGITNIGKGDFNSDNFRISKQSFSKGSALVKSVTFNDDDETVVLTLKEDFNLTAPKTPNLVISELSVVAKKTVKGTDGVVFSRTNPYKYDGEKSTIIGFVITGDNEKKVSDGDLSYPNGKMFKYVADGDTVVGTAALSGVDFCLEGRVYDGDKVYLKASNSPDKDIIKLYEEADLRFVNFTTNGLPSNNDLQILAEKDEFVYKIVDGKLASSGLKWSDDEYAWAGKIRTNAKYAISDIELKATADVAGFENPDTGSNDVVGVAAALAIVSLVAAGAVSLKK